MPTTARTFDRLAAPYRALETLAFGRDLTRARLAHLDRLVGLEEVLVLGDGDGRFAEALAVRSPRTRLTCLDVSPGMQSRARRRLTAVRAQDRVRFVLADALTADLGLGRYDAVTTLFFLDCFTQRQVEGLIPRVAAALKPSALWLYADFQVPPRGLARLRAKLWVGALYAFFRLSTDIGTDHLPEVDAPMARAGFSLAAHCELQAGLLRSAVFSRTADP
jgi:ubiquinone/menaquinone biosynthesis C-methylase UbiE